MMILKKQRCFKYNSELVSELYGCYQHRSGRYKLYHDIYKIKKFKDSKEIYISVDGRIIGNYLYTKRASNRILNNYYYYTYIFSDIEYSKNILGLKLQLPIYANIVTNDQILYIFETKKDADNFCALCNIK